MKTAMQELIDRYQQIVFNLIFAKITNNEISTTKHPSRIN